MRYVRAIESKSLSLRRNQMRKSTFSFRISYFSDRLVINNKGALQLIQIHWKYYDLLIYSLARHLYIEMYGEGQLYVNMPDQSWT